MLLMVFVVSHAGVWRVMDMCGRYGKGGSILQMVIGFVICLNFCYLFWLFFFNCLYLWVLLCGKGYFTAQCFVL